MKKSDDFFVSLKINNTVYEAHNPILSDALKDIKPEFYKTKGIITVTKGDKKVEKIMPLQALKRLHYNSEIPRIVLAKNLQLIMK